MKKRTILIVDDQREVRHMLRSALSALDSTLQIVDVPSGEEALLLASGQPPDVMIVDVRLPGISGLEVVKRARAVKPEVKLVLITGSTDPVVRQQVSEAGAEGYFYKPLPMDDFLAQVSRLLGLGQAGKRASRGESEAPTRPLPVRESSYRPLPSAPLPASQAKFEITTLSGRLGKLLVDSGGVAALLLDESGRVIERAGAWEPGEGLMTELLQAQQAAAGLSARLEKPGTDYLIFAGGKTASLVLAAVGERHSLVLVLLPGMDAERLAIPLATARLAAWDLPRFLPPPPPAVAPVAPPVEPAALPPVDPALDALFAARQAGLNGQDLDAFWEALAADNEIDGASRGALSFEQARKLGLAPDEPLSPGKPA
jgi:DNA-binding NarL/FixJ family response regulator